LNRKRIALLAVVALVIVGAYFASPYWALHRIQSAARDGNGDRLASYVDFPAVRESVKAQMQAVMLKKMLGSELRTNPLAGLGMIFAGGMVNAIVDGIVTPDNLAAMINNGNAPVAPATPAAPAAPNAADGAGSGSAFASPRITHGYDGLDAFKVTVHDPVTDSVSATWTLNRRAGFDWKLTDIRFAK
jgi:hypothetical protein